MSTYKQSGVDINRGNQFVSEIKDLVKKTVRPEVLTGIGPFAGLFCLKKYKNPVLVSSTDGVGTKIILARQQKHYKTIGIDCVAMCVNDIGCFGAEPLFFLDYLAASKLELPVLKEIVAGMALACQEVGCALLGGETAEMPGVYPEGEIDCAGFAVGVVEKEAIIDGKTIQPGDVVLGVASSGFHSNGFSLIRKIIADHSLNLDMETLLAPTRLYTPLILDLKKKVKLKGIAHITGGGLIENPARILPAGTSMTLKKESWPIPSIMKIFQEKGKLSSEEFLRVFNAGIGLVLVVSSTEKESALKNIQARGDKAWEIGTITIGAKAEVLFV